MATKATRTVEDKRRAEAQERHTAKNTGKKNERWPVVAEHGFSETEFIRFSIRPESTKGRGNDPELWIQLKTSKYQAQRKISTHELFELFDFIADNRDLLLDKSRELERVYPVAENKPINAAPGSVPPPPGDDAADIPPPPLPEMPPLDRRSEESMREWLIEAVPQYSDRYASMNKATLKSYVDTVIKTSGQFNRKGERLS